MCVALSFYAVLECHPTLQTKRSCTCFRTWSVSLASVDYDPVEVLPKPVMRGKIPQVSSGVVASDHRRQSKKIPLQIRSTKSGAGRGPRLGLCGHPQLSHMGPDPRQVLHPMGLQPPPPCFSPKGILLVSTSSTGRGSELNCSIVLSLKAVLVVCHELKVSNII